MRYEKPIVNVIDLQIKENIAAVDTTVYKASTGAAGVIENQIIRSSITGIAAGTAGLVTES